MPSNPQLKETSYSSQSINSAKLSNNQLAKEKKITLCPLAMRIPNEHGIYSLSKLRPKEVIDYTEFQTRFKNNSKRIRVCYEDTLCYDELLEKSEWVTAYGYGLDCWYCLRT